MSYFAKVVLVLALNHGAAILDSWSTRQVARYPGGFEANPLQKPFVHSRLLYVTSQPDAFLADYLMLRRGRTTKVQIACDALGWSITGAHLGSGLHNTKLNDQLEAFYARLKATNVVHATAPAKP